MNSSLSNQQTKSFTNRETLQDTRKLQITSDDRCLLVNVCANIATIELPSSVLVLMVKRVSQSADTSTRGASKQRRALINYEIDQLKLYLPVCSTVRQRLFQLQVMSLACVFIRKYNYTSATLAFSCPVMQINSNSKEQRQEELLGQGDSVYDLIDSRDHGTVQTILTSTVAQEFHDERVVLCRINTSSSTKRFAQDQCILIRSRIICQASCVASTQPSFVVTCTPVVMPTNVDALNVMGNPQIFHSIHEMDMRFISVDKIGCQLLGLQVDQMITLSWYSVLHPQDLLEAASKHKISSTIWSFQRGKFANYSEDQAVQLRANACWLYSWPSVIDFPQQPQPPTMMPTFNHLHLTTKSKSLECRSLIDNPFLLADEISTTKPPIDDLSNCMHSTFTDGRVMAKGEEPLVAFYSPLPDIESETIDRYLY
ncbi:neuronal PAS domain-containing protein 4 [Trichinella spiralis]|uniref:Neuronal PAS domain-containing protein 4 n=1 Tax=Trichinella spiralis TaxID=6334 RepID=E5S1W6_TRISP|nr:neuronal PAS domain-containing protein 4 [Trichinella spiralis]KRY37558.1 Neuronal PAS domain-containing protein 4 [Trichinella spiralis]